jgi:hypothetical protein
MRTPGALRRHVDPIWIERDRGNSARLRRGPKIVQHDTKLEESFCSTLFGNCIALVIASRRGLRSDLLHMQSGT